MLCINRKYTVSVGLPLENELVAKLNEFGISITNKRYYGTTFHGHDIMKVYFECMSNEDEMDALIEYLQLSFKGMASIIF